MVVFAKVFLVSLSMLSLFYFTGSNTPVKKNNATSESEDKTHWQNNLIRLKHLNDSTEGSYVENGSLFIERWDTLAQPKFWKTVMLMSADSCIVNVARNRHVLKKMSIDEWDSQSDTEKDDLKAALREEFGYPEDEKIYMTTGKADFYNFEAVLPSISKGVTVFKEEDVDPWYAQAILLIESPGKLAKSNVGAYGPFQLMPGVARTHGLRVDKYVDERKDFVRSAQGASSLIAKTCLPHARRILEEQGLIYNETDLWFRLFVLHVYHAGAYNVESVIKVIKPTEGSGQLIQDMWQTSAAKFKNASQNYSQLALAGLMILEELLMENCDYVVISE